MNQFLSKTAAGSDIVFGKKILLSFSDTPATYGMTMLLSLLFFSSDVAVLFLGPYADLKKSQSGLPQVLSNMCVLLFFYPVPWREHSQQRRVEVLVTPACVPVGGGSRYWSVGVASTNFNVEALNMHTTVQKWQPIFLAVLMCELNVAVH